MSVHNTTVVECQLGFPRRIPADPHKGKVRPKTAHEDPEGEEMYSSIISLTLRRLMSYIYMEHPFLMFLDHTQRRNTVGRTPLDE